MKDEFSRRHVKAKQQEQRYRDMPDIVVKVMCRYRAELFFKISRKTKLSRLFEAWAERMERKEGKKADSDLVGDSLAQIGGQTKPESLGGANSGSTTSSQTIQFIYTHHGRAIEVDQTPEEVGMDDGDEILAIELMDLTEGTETLVSSPCPHVLVF